MVTRGIKNYVREFIEQLGAQYFPYKMKGKEYHVQLAVRPIQLWELVFPNDQLQTVMRTIWEDQPMETLEGRMGKSMAMLRKMLKLKKIPPMEKEGMKRIVFKECIGKYALGIKEDYYDEEVKKENL